MDRLRRSAEVVCTYCQLSGFYLAPVVGPMLAYLLLYHSRLWPLVILYFVWMFYDWETPHKKGRRCRFLRGLVLWKYFIEYFPHRLVKTADLDPSSNHIFCLFPHGLMATSGLANFANDRSQARHLFPGFTFSGLTLNVNFYVPFFRELSMGYGLRSVSKESILYLLTTEKSRVLVLYPGGSAEAAKSSPGTYRLAVKNRRGFVNLAIRTGTNLVPVVAFGETDLFDNWIPAKGSYQEKILTWIRKITGVAPARFSGTGALGLLPYRRTVTTVVGKPLVVEQKCEPSTEDILRVHGQFLRGLEELFEQHKAKYLPHPHTTFLSIED